MDVNPQTQFAEIEALLARLLVGTRSDFLVMADPDHDPEADFTVVHKSSVFGSSSPDRPETIRPLDEDQFKYLRYFLAPTLATALHSNLPKSMNSVGFPRSHGLIFKPESGRNPSGRPPTTGIIFGGFSPEALYSLGVTMTQWMYPEGTVIEQELGVQVSMAFNRFRLGRQFRQHAVTPDLWEVVVRLSTTIVTPEPGVPISERNIKIVGPSVEVGSIVSPDHGALFSFVRYSENLGTKGFQGQEKDPEDGLVHAMSILAGSRSRSREDGSMPPDFLSAFISGAYADFQSLGVPFAPTIPGGSMAIGVTKPDGKKVSPGFDSIGQVPTDQAVYLASNARAATTNQITKIAEEYQQRSKNDSEDWFASSMVGGRDIDENILVYIVYVSALALQSGETYATTFARNMAGHFASKGGSLFAERLRASLWTSKPEFMKAIEEADDFLRGTREIAEEVVTNDLEDPQEPAPL